MFNWLYPLTRKSDVTSCFIKFKTLVENLFSTNIKIIHTDNGGEFVNKSLFSFLSSYRISHQLTCPYTSQQNSVVERKHRHIVSMGQCLLLQASLPETCWVHAFHMATFLINRTSTPILNGYSPFQVLFHRSLDLSLIKTFGCLCFPHLTAYTKHKLEPRSIPYVFLSYAANHKGYKCFHVPTRRLYISRHVIFHEQSFPFFVPSSSSLSTSSSSALFYSPTSSLRLPSQFSIQSTSVPSTSSSPHSPLSSHLSPTQNSTHSLSSMPFKSRATMSTSSSSSLSST